MKPLTELINSKKFLVFAAGIALVLIAKYVLKDDATATKITGLVMAYLFGQGIADNGVAAAQVQAASPKPPDTVVTQINEAEQPK